ncbi:hypothetical protein LshimejAT787_1400170 [Lyophyllum shimeji]|uniref:Uncharacterized protein n=1 Tax=Lyophyllum shimeji TaxID=47721 RepID=A0A9P3PWY0_LYOSH|nr:hypothetical protein LshimejAT787_1400170 [Lyophyllum shimeji]
MLALRPHPPPDHWRGRSRQVSHAALARQASEERRSLTRRTGATTTPERTTNEKSDLFFHDASIMVGIHQEKPIAAPTPLKPALRPTFVPPPPPLSISASASPDYYDSPPSPPRSLEDQVHVAYALDDIPLAKMLLLRLKGIDVTSPDDPRIADVRDEDFDFCFVPRGRLMDEEDEKALQERQRRELEKLVEKRRIDRLRDCERIWEQGKKRLREAKALAARRREAEEKQRAEEQQRAAEGSRVPAGRVSRLRTSGAAPRPIVAYKLTTPSSREQEPFVYDFMPHMQSRPPSKPQVLSQPKSKSPFSRALFDDSRAVPFSDVLASMQGPLFPLKRRAASPLATNASQDRKKRREAELLESLLKVVESEEDERRRRKGKAPEKPPVRRRRTHPTSPCAACSDSSSSASSSSYSSPSSSVSPTPSRRSWLSFSSASSSTSTAATTPSSSPPTWFSKSASPTRKVRPKSWFLGPPSPHTFTSPPPHSCRPCTHRTHVAPADSPLQITTAARPEPSRTRHHPLPASASNPITISPLDDTVTPHNVVIRRISQLLDLAKGFQHAYMNAAMFAVSSASDSLDDRHVSAPSVLSVPSRKHTSPRSTWRPLGPPGQRVSAADVKVFLDTSPSSRNPSPSRTSLSSSRSPSTPAPPPRPIPLRSRNTAADDDDDSPDGDAYNEPSQSRTVLPNPLPYPLRFKPQPVPCRSPFRVHAHLCDTRNSGEVHGPPWGVPAIHAGANGAVVLRVRAVENPVYLRVKAAENVSAARGGVGSGKVREGGGGGGMGSAGEKVLQIAYEGIGRSWLRVESVVVRASAPEMPRGRAEARMQMRQRQTQSQIGGAGTWW